MERLSRRTHRVFDYLIAVTLVFSPSLFGFEEVAPARVFFVTVGAGLIIYSVLTDYLFSIGKPVPFQFHRILDGIAAALLVFAPWVVGYVESLTSLQLGFHFALAAALALIAWLTPDRVTGAYEVEPPEKSSKDRAA